MFLWSLAVDEDVVKVHDDETVQALPENLLHELHEGGWGVAQSEGKHEELEVAVPGVECRLGDVVRVDADLMVSAPQVQFAEVLRSQELVEQLLDVGQRSIVLDSLR